LARVSTWRRSRIAAANCGKCGRDSNIAYVAPDQPDDSHATPKPDQVHARAVLYGILQHSGVGLSAHQTMEAEQDAASTIAQLAAEYETAAAPRDRWIGVIRECGLTPSKTDDVVGSDALGPLCQGTQTGRGEWGTMSSS